MLAFKSSEYFSLFRYFNVIYALSVVLIIVLLNGNSQISALVTDQIETETKFAPEHIEKSCVEKCPDQNRNVSSNADCMDNCDRNQCAAGCKLWETALDTSCMVACNKTEQDVEDWYCVMGCNNAISQYFKWLMNEIGTPPAPALLADSLTATSLSLEWEIPARLSKFMKRRRNILRNYLVQWRYEESGNDWKYCRNQSMEDNSTIHVENLQPYTKYRFRVALILSAFREIELYSEQSLVIITAEEGPPQSEPAIVRAVAVDHTRISISWEQGRLKNGPILFYVLQMKESDQDGYFAYKDIPREQQEILIENLKPSTEYTIGIKMRNKAGEGPAAEVKLKTHNKPEVRNDEETLKLIIVSNHQILMQGPKFFYEPPNFIYNTSDAIIGVGIHVARKLLFITDETRAIYKAPLDHSAIAERIRIYSTEGTNQIPLALSVDWLNDKLYILFESLSMNQKAWQISRCNFDGSHSQVVYGGLQSKPAHFQVDPFNGYLFWSINGTDSDSGLFRLDLSDVSNGVKHEINPKSIFNEDRVGVFTIDYVHYKLLLPIESLNTVKSLNLNGENYQDIRKNTQTPMFESVKSFAMANDLFYWTSGDAVLMEEYHDASKYYYDNRFRDFAKLSNFLSVCVKLPSAQPIPKPLNPPSNVQALLGNDRAKVSWRIPHLLSIQGRGAWQDWTYEVEINDEYNNDTKQTINEIKGLHYTVNNLIPDTMYRFRVAAYTKAGYSPYSVEFIGQTLKTPHNRYLIWASHDGLVQSDILGDNIRILVPQPKLNQCNITNIEWYEDVLLFVCNSSLFSFNRTNNVTEKIQIEDSVQTLAIDWIGKRLYWFNPLHQVIQRGSLINYEPEVLFPLSATEVDIKIDSLHGFLYFSTGHTVEFCRLNCRDKDKKEFYHIQTYSGKKVMGLTLDFDMKRVYWIVRSYDGSTLMSAPLAESDSYTFELQEFPLSEKRIQGPLAYLSSRLLWLQDDHTVAISNLTGNNVAHIKNIELNDLKVFFVVDPTQHMIPDSIYPLNVVPEPINSSTVLINGTWNSFNVSWRPVETVTYGEVFYEIRYLNNTTIDERPFIVISDKSLLPYSPLNISIKAFTYWASSPVIRLHIHSPAAAPSQPTNTRIFISHMHNPIKSGLNIEAVFRWNQPEFLNGPLTGYQISCWYEKNNSRSRIFTDYHLQPEISEKYMENLPINATLYCKVKAVTIAGEGNYSSLISMETHNEKPIPRVFASGNDGIYNVDLDLKKQHPIVNVGSRVDCLCYIAMDKQLFWTDENSELMSYSRNGKQKLFSINSPVLSITVDWIERIIYWSQSDKNGSSINAFNLNTHKTSLLLRCPHFVYNLNVAPLNRKMFWVEVESTIATRGTLMSYSFDESISNVFRDSKNSPITVAQKTMFLDTFTENEEKILWLNEYNQLISTDIRSTRTKYLNFSYASNAMNLIKDSVRFYWTLSDILYAENPEEESPYQLKLSYPIKILPIYRQNYPPLHCLLPGIHFERGRHIRLDESGDRFLKLRLPVPKTYENCTFEPMLLKYNIMYTSLTDNQMEHCTPQTCHLIETYDKVIEIQDLKPFTKYQFQISISNFYIEEMNKTVNFTLPVIFQTKTGAPSKPRDLTATILSPTEVNLKWIQPLEWNGETVRYEVQYQTENEINGLKNQMQLFIKDDNVTTVNITRLLPNQPYKVWIRAYTTETLYSQSLPLKIKTLPDPEPIKLVAATSTSLDVEWKTYKNAIKYMISCRPVELDDSSAEIILDSNMQTNSTNVKQFGNVLSILNLHPKTQYMFWLSLYFENRSEPYIWPQNERFIYETKADRPNAPGKPIIIHLQSDVYKVTWTAAHHNGAAILEYNLEGLRYRASNNRIERSTNASESLNSTAQSVNTLKTMRLTADEKNSITDEWTVYYRGNDTYWIAKDLIPISMYSFKVRALNANGWGIYSDISDPITEQAVFNGQREYLLVAVAAPALVTIILVMFTCLVCAYRSKAADKKAFQEPTASRAELELANLNRVPHFVQNDNALYTVTGVIIDSDIALLPQISREQITMGDFLGSGAFGEVYEGTVKDIGDEIETRVAIKTLRKGATDQEKTEFLQEAKLMSNFKHKHILSLIGIYLDSDALYIIMELMQGGDLLSFLRQSRPCEGGQSALTLLDLTTMCVDIASGCRYLEEMHFVHRDLACRNCLVSSVDPENRVVKIGDFGLARDIYKNDYYRKDGEGLLPVRWMSPESLVDGVFTSQSDIWAFGVLCWEIMTLGQQPYPARNNVEVLHYVRDGGRLDKPLKCPEDLYQLMLKCWSYRPEDRPTFRYCLDILQSLRSNYENIHINMENTHRNLIAGGIFNRSYLLADENHNHQQGVKYVNTAIGPELLAQTYSIPKPTQPDQKYLEIVYNENDYPTPVNSYEIPISTLDESQIIDSALNVQNVVENVNSIPKNRTISTSSTVSETSVFHPVSNNSNLVTKNVILTVALPNSKEDCTSNEKLLMTSQQQSIHPHDISAKKLQQLYANSNIENAILNCDGITSM